MSDQSMIANAKSVVASTGLQSVNLGTLIVVAFLAKGILEDMQESIAETTQAIETLTTKVEGLDQRQADQAAEVAETRRGLDQAAKRLDEAIARVAVLEACLRNPQSCPLLQPGGAP